MDNEKLSLEEMAEEYEYIEICAQPVYTLSECLSAATDNDGGFDYKADRLSFIKEHFCTSLFLCDNKQLDFIRFAAELSESRTPLDRVIYYPLSAFADNDFIFVFSHGGQYYLVLPVELLEIFREVTADEDFAAINAEKLEFKMYVNALLNLYGAYEIDQFVDVWNLHHKNKINYDSAEEFLSDMSSLHSNHYAIEDFVVHECLDDEEFDDLQDVVCDMDYYIPTKSVIREYAKLDVDIRVPGEMEMDEFLAGFIFSKNDYDDLQWEIKESCQRLKSPEEMRTILAEIGFPLDDETAVRQFERLYNRLRDNTHIWELRGFMPYQYAAETGENIKRFELPKGKMK